jgi:SAM-dependent methyltransferase
VQEVQEAINSHAEFDEYANDYDAAMSRALAVSGESAEFFAERRISWLKKCLAGAAVSNVIDYGCGTGLAIPFLFDVLDAKSVVAIDPSPRIREIAQQTHGHRNVIFCSPQEYQPHADIDLVFSNGTFHHIQPPARPATIDYISRLLRPGGLFVLSENNSWNPGTLYVMKRCAFDKDAIPLSVTESQRLVKENGFEIVRTDFLFIFPRALRWLRPIEPLLTRFPIGAQYQIICRKPD